MILQQLSLWHYFCYRMGLLSVPLWRSRSRSSRSAWRSRSRSSRSRSRTSMFGWRSRSRSSRSAWRSRSRSSRSRSRTSMFGWRSRSTPLALWRTRSAISYQFHHIFPLFHLVINFVKIHGDTLLILAGDKDHMFRL